MRCLAVLLSLTVALLGGCGGGDADRASRSKSRNEAIDLAGSPTRGESISQRVLALRRAWGKDRDAKTETESRVADAIAGVLELLQHDMKSGRSAQVLAAFDFRLMARRAYGEGKDAEFYETEAAAIKKMARESWLGANDFLMWEKFEVERIVFSSDRRIAVVYSTHQRSPGDKFRCRWWFANQDLHWRIYDFDEIKLGQQHTRMLAEQKDTRWSGLWVPAWDKVSRASELARQEKFEQALDVLTAMRWQVTNLPPLRRAFYWYWLGMCHRQLWNNDDALRNFDSCLKQNPAVLDMHYYRADLLNRLGRHEEALEAVGRYVDALGTDYAILVLEGLARQALGKSDAAARAFSSALNYFPDGYEALTGLAETLPDSSAEKFATRFKAVKDPEALFDSLASTALYEGKLKMLSFLTAAFAVTHPDNPDVAYYRAQVLAGSGKYTEARETIFAAIDRAPDDERDAFLDAYLDFCTADGKWQIGYEKLSTEPLIFNKLARRLAENKADKSLRKLIDMHRKDHAKDCWLDYYEGELELLGGRPEKAADWYVSGRKKAAEDDKESFRSAGVSALYDAGKLKLAYGMMRPRRETFAQLASLLWADGRVAELGELIDWHYKADADDANLSLWRAELAYSEGKYTKTVSYLNLYRKERKIDGSRPWRFQYLKISALIRLKRLEEAERLASRIAGAWQDQFYLGVVYAVSGKQTKAIAAFSDALRTGAVGAWEIYDHPDCGAITRGAAYADLHLIYPIPVELTEKEK